MALILTKLFSGMTKRVDNPSGVAVTDGVNRPATRTSDAPLDPESLHPARTTHPQVSKQVSCQWTCGPDTHCSKSVRTGANMRGRRMALHLLQR